MRSLFAAALTCALLVCTLPSRAQQPNLPPGEGRDIVAIACTQCHGPAAFMQLRQGPEAWRFTVYDMILRGAQVLPSEIQSTVAYLTGNFGLGINVPPPVVQVSLPEGQGKDLVAQRCSLCHALDRVGVVKRAPAEWDSIVSRMIFLGTPLSPDEAKTIASYLRSNLSTGQITQAAK